VKRVKLADMFDEDADEFTKLSPHGAAGTSSSSLACHYSSA
jgi:hypothetical protein